MIPPQVNYPPISFFLFQISSRSFLSSYISMWACVFVSKCVVNENALLTCAGQVLLDGHDIKTLKLRWLRQQIGLVSQEPALFATTIKENILLGRPDADQVEIEEAARVANAHSFIVKLPDGFDTQVS